MAKLTKEQYAYRRESAARRNADNEAIAVEHGMTEEQAELISKLCTLRHELHSNMDKVASNDSQLNIKGQLVELAREIDEAGLPQVPCIPIAEGAYIDIDSLDELLEYGEWPESGTDEWQEKYDDEDFRIYNELSNLNKEIEKYLAEIDRQYGTKWCPTGALRIM